MLSVVVALLGLLQPFLYRWIIDNVVLLSELEMGDKLKKIGLFIVFFAALVLASYVAEFGRSYCATVLNNKITAKLRYVLLEHMLRLPLSIITKMKVGGAASRLNGDTAAVSQVANRALFVPAVAALKIGVALAVVFFKIGL